MESPQSEALYGCRTCNEEPGPAFFKRETPILFLFKILKIDPKNLKKKTLTTTYTKKIKTLLRSFSRDEISTLP